MGLLRALARRTLRAAPQQRSSFDMLMDQRDELMDIAQREGFNYRGTEGATGSYLHHASNSPWLQRGVDAPNLDAGEGFGMHVGSRNAALTAATNNAPRGRATPHITQVALRGDGQTLEMYDISDWGSKRNWLVALRDGLTNLPSEDVAMATRILEQTPSDRVGPVMRRFLLDRGIRRVSYKNRFEDRGENSLIALDAGDVRSVDPTSTRAGFALFSAPVFGAGLFSQQDRRDGSA